MNRKPNSIETIARRVGTQRANRRARVVAALARRRKEKGERRKRAGQISNFEFRMMNKTDIAVGELVQVGFEKYGGEGDAGAIVLRGKDKG